MEQIVEQLDRIDFAIRVGVIMMTGCFLGLVFAIVSRDRG